jgi:hypothetical protein
MRLTYAKAIAFCGVIWGYIGFKLLTKGFVHFNTLHRENLFSERQLSFYIGIALLIGLIKGKWVLKKSADRVIKHIVSFDEPLLIRSFLPKSFYFVMLGMMALGMSVRYLPIPLIVKGVMDAAVGTGLLFGAMHYIKKAVMIKIALKNL